MRRERPHARLVVVRDEWPDAREQLLDRNPGDRHEPQSRQARPAHLVHDVDAVDEVVEAQRIEVELALVLVEGEEPRVPVPVSRQGSDPHQPDQQLVRVEARGTPRERRDLGAEAIPGDVPEQVRMEALEAGPELADVLRRSRDRG